jgi:hypothetical protein
VSVAADCILCLLVLAGLVLGAGLAADYMRAKEEA